MAALLVCQAQWLEAVVESYSHDERAQQLIAKLAEAPDSVADFTLRDGLLRYKCRIWVGADPELHTRLITAVHSTAVGGHSGMSVTYRRLKQLFA